MLDVAMWCAFRAAEKVGPRCVLAGVEVDFGCQ